MFDKKIKGSPLDLRLRYDLHLFSLSLLRATSRFLASIPICSKIISRNLTAA